MCSHRYERTFRTRVQVLYSRSKEFLSLFFALISGILQSFRADEPAGEVDERTRSGSKRYRSAIVHFEVKLELHLLKLPTCSGKRGT